MKGKLLIVDDDVRINELLQDIFTMEDYEVVSARNGEEALHILEQDHEIDLLLLDVMMPVLNGWDVLPYIKEHFHTRIILLTALSDEASEVRGFREGADDYVAKPFSRAVLVERVRRLVDEKRMSDQRDLLFQDLRLCQRNCKVFLGEEELRLTNKEYHLLQMLLSNSNIALSREQILDQVWGIGYEGENRVVDSQVKLLRRSLGEYGQNIRTIRGVGYCFDGEVKER